MDKNRLDKQINFLLEAERMKDVYRKNIILSRKRNENDAEHSFSLALFALTLAEYAKDDKVNILRAVKMALVHDLIEVYAGDTFCYDKEGNLDKEIREKEAADKLYGILPEEQGAEFRALWEEFDAMETPDSLYAAAMDRFQPFILNLNTDYHTWKLGNVTSEDVFKRLSPLKTATPALWRYVEERVCEAIALGKLKK